MTQETGRDTMKQLPTLFYMTSIQVDVSPAQGYLHVPGERIVDGSDAEVLHQNFPNPFNPGTEITTRGQGSVI